MNDRALITFEPPFGRAAEWGTWVLRYRVGAGGIPAGGGIRAQLPDSWHVWRRCSAKGMQSEDPSKPNFVTARSSRAGAEVICEVEGGTIAEYVKSARMGVDGTQHWFAFVTRVTLDSPLVEGDTIEIVYGDTAGGSKGFVGPLTAEGAERVRVAVDATGSGRHVLASEHQWPVIESVASDAVEVVATAPSVLKVGESGHLHVALLDGEGNRATGFAGTIDIKVEGGSAEIQRTVELSSVDRGILRVPFRASRPGVVRFRVEASDRLTTLSNPVDCRAWVTERLYWGDTHSHAALSFDAVGQSPHEYARDVAALDFYALSEHAEWWPAETWEQIRELARRFNEPGRFATILAYEATFGHPWGHHNVFFRSDDGPVLGADRGTLLDLWKVLNEGNAITVPHHTGVHFAPWAEGHIPGTVTPNPDWQYHNSEFRRLIEIYSAHGQSEAYGPDHPLSYENCPFTFNTSSDGPYYASDAWLRGYELGVVGSSDDHRGQPGRGEYGLAALFSPELERGSLFDAMRGRHSYATTGARILLYFYVDGVPMGGRRKSSGPVNARLEVHGTGLLDKVEIIRADLDKKEISTSQSWNPGSLDFAAGWTDESPPARGFYYLRVAQRERYRDRIPMAWSSPVWVGAEATQPA